MTPYERAKAELGTKEVVGVGSNAKVMGYYTASGNAWVKDDSVAWCAAFVGAMLARSQIKPTGSLAARSYLKWGSEVPFGSAQPGDIAVFERPPNPVQGHVAFFEQFVGDQVQVLGGNQSDSVSRAYYPRSRLLSIRRAALAAAPQPPHSAPKPIPAPTTPATAQKAPVGAVAAGIAILAALAWAFLKGN
jgi:uncharacterized protein (TIGR02594 family)